MSIALLVLASLRPVSGHTDPNDDSSICIEFKHRGWTLITVDEYEDTVNQHRKSMSDIDSAGCPDCNFLLQTL